MDKEALIQMVIDRTDGWLDAVRAAWDCLTLDDIRRIRILIF